MIGRHWVGSAIDASGIGIDGWLIVNRGDCEQAVLDHGGRHREEKGTELEVERSANGINSSKNSIV